MHAKYGVRIGTIIVGAQECAPPPWKHQEPPSWRSVSNVRSSILPWGLLQVQAMKMGRRSMETKWSYRMKVSFHSKFVCADVEHARNSPGIQMVSTSITSSAFTPPFLFVHPDPCRSLHRLFYSISSHMVGTLIDLSRSGSWQARFCVATELITASP